MCPLNAVFYCSWIDAPRPIIKATYRILFLVDCTLLAVAQIATSGVLLPSIIVNFDQTTLQHYQEEVYHDVSIN